MIPQPLVRMLSHSTEENVEAVLEDDSCVFMVDWRGDDDAIVRDCEDILLTGVLSAEMTWAPMELFIIYRGQRHRVPLVIGAGDRHITLHTLNQVLAPDFEIRWCRAMEGDDTLGCIPLSANDWRELEKQFGSKVADHFGLIQERPNLFTGN